jgi:hypothetical protein
LPIQGGEPKKASTPRAGARRGGEVAVDSGSVGIVSFKNLVVWLEVIPEREILLLLASTQVVD